MPWFGACITGHALLAIEVKIARGCAEPLGLPPSADWFKYRASAAGCWSAGLSRPVYKSQADRGQRMALVGGLFPSTRPV